MYNFTDKEINDFKESVLSKSIVPDYTHDFYNYPAKFSPLFARSAIKLFSKPGDYIFDPFMGGGTTIIESLLLSRNVIGIDINQLAYFVSKVKIQKLKKSDIDAINIWKENCLSEINIRTKIHYPIDQAKKKYQRNLDFKNTWRIRKYIELLLDLLDLLDNKKQKIFIRCAILKVGQWALDNKKQIPNVKQFLIKLEEIINNMISSSQIFNKERSKKSRAVLINRSIIGIETEPKIKIIQVSPKLILTSPPYPGVHILYHRWQISGRKETPAPYWITNMEDGSGASFYTMGSRKQKGLKDYYQNIFSAFKSISKICNKESIIIQLIAFSEPKWQLYKYLETMNDAGFLEVKFTSLANSSDNRLWRIVPNRKWYTDYNKSKCNNTKNEVVLFHKLS